jgi:thioredoxin 1
MNRSVRIAVIAFVAMVTAAVAMQMADRSAQQAAALRPKPTLYTQAAYDAAIKAGKPVLLDFWASWCPVCAAQDSVITSKVLGQPTFADVTVLRVDIDSQQDVMERFGVTGQSVLVAIRDGREVARMTGGSNPDRILALVRTLLA